MLVILHNFLQHVLSLVIKLLIKKFTEIYEQKCISTVNASELDVKLKKRFYRYGVKLNRNAKINNGNKRMVINEEFV